MLLVLALVQAVISPGGATPNATGLGGAGPACASATIGTVDDGAELRLAVQQYSAFYGPHVVLQLNRTPAQFQTQLIRIGGRTFGDGRPVVAGANSGFPDGGWQLLQIGRNGVTALSTATDIELVDRTGAVISLASDQQAVASFAACLDSLPVGSNETPADAPSNGWRFISLPANRLVGHGVVPMLDYPRAALREEREGETVVQVIVQPYGTATDCTIASSSGSPDLDLASCEATRRMRFRVATDENSEPIAAPVRIPFSWRIG